MDLPQALALHPTDISQRVQEGDNEREFRWVAATRQELTELDIPPYFIADEIGNLPRATRHLVWHDGDLDDK